MNSRILHACALAIGLVMTGVFVPAYAAGPLPSDTFVACGRNSSGPGIANCISLQAAITKATPILGTVTIEMMPGQYCPPVFPALNTVYWQHLNFVGIGLGAYGPSGAPTTFTGPEALLTKFSWSSACGASMPAAVVEVDGGGTGQVGLSNLTVEGSSSGPSTGVFVNNASVTMHDVIVENFTGDGVNATSTSQYSGASIQNSSIVHNAATGVALAGTYTGANYLSVQQSTIANNGIGIQQSGNLGANLVSNTIAHNTTGFSGATSQVGNTINAGNATDCAGPGWEGSGTNDYNLVGSSCAHSAAHDQVTSGSIAALAANGGPTYSILPPLAASGAGASGWCGTYDQREYLRTSTSLCDIGAVEVGHASSDQKTDPYPAPGTDDMGLVAEGQQGGDLFRVYSTGAGLVRGYDVTLSGTGFTMVGDSCSHSALETNFCSVGVLATPSRTHQQITGTLTIKLSSGNLVYSLAAHGPDVTSFVAPTTTTINYGARRTLKTIFTDTTTQSAVKGEKVTLQEKAAGASTYTDVATRTTSATGAASVLVKPRATTQYRWRYVGSGTRYSSTSSAGAVRVAQVVTAKLADSTVARNKVVTVSGTVTPKENGKKVVLQVRSNGHWVAHGSAVVHGASYTLHTTFASRGRRSLRVVRAATSKNSAGISRRRTLRTT